MIFLLNLIHTRMRLLLFFILFSEIVKTLQNPDECVFKTIQKNVLETEPRPSFAEVDPECSGDLIR